jgi:hypothetical protein
MDTITLSVMSLFVAILAVVVGPVISLKIANKQIKSSTFLSKKQIISPIRQAWINELRSIISRLASKAAYYKVAGYEEREDEEYYHIIELEYQLKLYLNPKEKDHSELLNKVSIMTAEIGGDTMEKDVVFWRAHEEVLKLSGRILKREWERVKADI